MKRTPLKRKSKNPLKVLMQKADRAIQDYYRQQNLKCEGCGRKADLMHHFVLKSHSNRLRYEEKNLIAICKKCHSKIHCFGQGQLIEGKIILGRGREWLGEIEKLKREHISFNESELNKIIEKYAI